MAPNVTPETKLNTNLISVIAVIMFAFGAGGWATWMSLQVEFLKAQIAEIRSDMEDLTKHKAITRNP